MTDAQKDHDRLVRNLELVEGRRTTAEMSALLNITPPTYRKKRRTPELLTYAEIKALCKSAKVSIADFTGGELALKGM